MQPDNANQDARAGRVRLVRAPHAAPLRARWTTAAPYSGRRRAPGGAFLLALLCAALLLAACAPGGPGGAAPRGTIHWSIEGITDIARLDPARPADFQTNIVLGLIFGGLVRLSGDLQVQGDAAERWTVSDDGRVYTFTLRENLRFGDGSPANAEAFVHSLTRTIDPDTGRPFAAEFLKAIVGSRELAAGQAEELAGVRALDARTLQITLDSPQAYFLSLLTYALAYVVPPGAIEAAGDEWLERAYGTGPFKVRDYMPGKGITLEPNPHYWGGAPGVESVEFSFFADSAAAVDAYLAGQVDIMGSPQSGVPAARIDELRARPDLQTISAPVVRYVGFNNSRPPFDNLLVRQAFAQAVDKESLADETLAGTVNVARRILPADVPGTDLPIEAVEFDPVGARSSLTQAGYVSGSDLPPVSLTFVDEPDVAAVAAALQRDWRDTLGINVTLDPVPLEELIRRLDGMLANPQEGMDFYLSVWGLDYPDPHNFLSLQLQSSSPYNNGRWISREFDELTTQADQLSDQRRTGDRLRLYNRAEQIALTEVGWLPLYNPQVSVLIRPTVRGLVFTSVGIIAPSWSQVRIEQPAQ